MGETTELVPVSRPQSNGHGLVPANVGDALKLAEVMCKGKLVPQHLQNSVADCLMVIEQAARWGLSPFAVAQATSVIQGKLMFEGKLVAAVINARGGLSKRLNYRYANAGRKRSCVAFGTLAGEEEPREVEVVMEDVATNNRMWQTQPDQQLMYSAARVWARRHAPELMLGVYSPEEFNHSDAPAPVRTKPAPIAGVVADDLREQPPEVQEIAVRGITPGTGVSLEHVYTAPKSQPLGVDAPRSAALGKDDVPHDADGVVTDGEEGEENILDRVPRYDFDERNQRWEQVGDAPKASNAMIAKIHIFRQKLGHQLDRVVTDPVTKKKSVEKEGKFKQKLRTTFGKESAGELSVPEASRALDYLQGLWDKMERNMDRGNDSVAPAERVPGSDDAP